MMISRHVEANLLMEYYRKLYDLHAGAHKKEYMLVHDEIKKYLVNCDSYTEMGINQGATLAAAVLENPKTVRAYDIGLKWYNEARHLFDKYASENKIDLEVFEISTLDCVIDETDLLYIDTMHKYDHLKEELSLHGNKVKKYMIFHDTNAVAALRKAVEEYVAENLEWKIITDCKINVGFMTIKRTQQ